MMSQLAIWLRRNVPVTTVTIVVLATVAVARGQDADPPSRVARISYLTGAVSFEPASLDGWADASLNYPMTTGDNLYTDSGARAVLRIGSNSVRLNSSTNFQFVNLSDNVVQTSINSGALSLRVRHLFDGESWEVDTPNGAVTLLRVGEYRVDTDPSRSATVVTVRAGDAEVTAGNQSFPVHSGQSAYLDSSGSPPDVQDLGQQDDFDSFVASRDRMEDVPPPQYVSPDMDGYEDLSANGDWGNAPDYGPIWYPRVEQGWTPYRDGRWAWVDPWGWTWIDNEPWGFAPFHYGRWADVNNRWGWCPGPVAQRVYYAPALVAFVGGATIGAGGGLVGWFPLGPREPYYPAYHVSPAYIRQVNVTNTRITNINVTNVTVNNVNYVNRNAMIAVPQNDFVSARPVQHAAVRIDPNRARQAQVIGSAPRVAPRPESVLAASGTRRASPPPAAIANRPVVAKLSPPPAPVPFAARQQLLQQHPGSPLDPAKLQGLRARAGSQTQAGRMAVHPINTKEVHPVTPTVRRGPAPMFARRSAGPPGRPGQPAAKPNPVTQPPPAAHPANAPAGRAQPQPPVHQPPPAVRAQPQPPVHQPPAEREPPPAARPQPRPERATPPPAHKPPPKAEEGKPEGKKPREQQQPR